MSYSSLAANKKQNNSNKIQSFESWLQEVVSYDYGYRYKGRPIHCNYNETVVAFLQKQLVNGQCQTNNEYFSRISRDKIRRHQSGEDTFYFTADARKPETLAMIDIDCHKIGSYQDAEQFAAKLKTFWPALYCEPSTNGNGIHAYLIVKTNGASASRLNAAYNTLQTWLRTQAVDSKIELVEVKGQAPVITWGKRLGEVAGYKAGQLAKLPRGDCRATSSVSVADLEALGNSLQVNGVAAPRVTPRHAGPRFASLRSPPAAEVHNSIKRPIGNQTATPSIKGKHIDTADLPHALKVAQRLLCITGRPSHKHRRPSRNDIAYFLLLTKFFTHNPALRKDQSMPTERYRGLWQACYKAGDFTTSFDSHKFKAIRDWLADLGLLETIDARYWRGQAARWRAAKQLLEMLEEREVIRESILYVSVFRRVWQPTNWRPVFYDKICWLEQAVPKIISQAA